MNGHLAADAELYLKRVHADEVPGVEERLVVIRGRHEPIVRVLRGTSVHEKMSEQAGRHGSSFKQRTAGG